MGCRLSHAKRRPLKIPICLSHSYLKFHLGKNALMNSPLNLLLYFACSGKWHSLHPLSCSRWKPGSLSDSVFLITTTSREALILNLQPPKCLSHQLTSLQPNCQDARPCQHHHCLKSSSGRLPNPPEAPSGSSSPLSSLNPKYSF